jgi:hypothetical protein
VAYLKTHGWHGAAFVLKELLCLLCGQSHRCAVTYPDFDNGSYSENPNKMQLCIKILLSLILNEAQHVSGDNVQKLHVRQHSTYAKPEAACAVLGS